MTIQIAHITWNDKDHPESRNTYLDLSGFFRMELLREVLRDPAKYDAMGISYTIVAEVNTDDLEDAYERTNTINRLWWFNTGVTKMFKGEGCRSTSMGDLMFRNGKTYVVAAFGFEEVIL